ncbi:hypothetical protein [Streptomyces sp. NBC_01565]|uniref:hypothetical protein n=1 Tax=unclassified Streptomyces TaxID=2593676 RepID=UPI00225558C0|nr:hypothetical protein [Streptomyces sp. NBC_01565]MCX4545714.1 hypothetical protein [Streptomyces sp. NBC_01565]
MTADEEIPEPVFEINVPLPEMIDLPMLPQRVMHGTPGDRLTGRVSFGVPYVRPLDSDALTDLGLREFAGQGAVRAFRLLALQVNFAVDRDDLVLDATVGVILRNDSPTSPGAPLARTLEPMRLAGPVTRSSTVAVTAKLGIVEPQVTRQTTGSGGDPLLVADGLGSSEPVWFFRRTGRQNLEGSYQLMMVVEVPPAARASAMLALAASVRHRKFGIIRYRAQMPPDLALVRL